MLIDGFCRLAEEVYDIKPHLYSTSHVTKERKGNTTEQQYSARK